MEADYLHLIANHIPIFSVGFGLLILGWGLLKKIRLYYKLPWSSF